MSVRTIEQKMNSVSVWNGAAPVGNKVLGNDIESYPEGASGGLFDFQNDNPIIVRQILVQFGSGTTSWSLTLVDIDAVEIEVASGASAAPLVASITDALPGGLIILQGQKLKLTSAGGPTTASRARISVDRVRS